MTEMHVVTDLGRHMYLAQVFKFCGLVDFLLRLR